LAPHDPTYLAQVAVQAGQLRCELPSLLLREGQVAKTCSTQLRAETAPVNRRFSRLILLLLSLLMLPLLHHLLLLLSKRARRHCTV
jgi:hypothetical protein